MEELKLIKEFPHKILATDEVGRGPLGGPVVAGAVGVYVEDALFLKHFLKSLKALGVGDSKKISSSDRVAILKKLGLTDLSFRKTGCFSNKGIKIFYTTWDMDPLVIDEENILHASLRAMREGAESISSHFSSMKKIPTTVLIDGPMKFRWGNKKSSWHEIPLVKGDSRSLLIGLASLVAKEKRDAFMKEMHEIYPQYGFNSHFGYPTKAHRQAIEIHGPCPIHRKTFRGVKEFLRD
jgi:ribonuclease HII